MNPKTKKNMIIERRKNRISMKKVASKTNNIMSRITKMNKNKVMINNTNKDPAKKISYKPGTMMRIVNYQMQMTKKI